MNQSVVWAILVVVFLVIEAVVPGLVSIWFALAAFLVTILSLFVSNIYINIAVFCISSLIFVIITRKVVKKFIDNKKVEHSNLDSVVGKQTKIISVIDEDEYNIKIEGKYWTGKSSEILEKGDLVVVKEIIGNKLILTKE